MRAKHKLRQVIDSLWSGALPPTQELYARLLSECVRSNDVVQAQKLQSHMEQTLALSEPHHVFLHNRLLQLYARNLNPHLARKLFDRMPHRDVYSYNALLSAYAKSGSINELRHLFHQMSLRDSVSYNTVISGFSNSGFCEEALEVFLEMERKGFDATDYTLVSALQACSQLSDLNRGKQIHNWMVVRGSLGNNAFVANSLTDMYAKCGEIDAAKHLFDGMADKNVVSWNSMISGYLKNGQPEKSIELLHSMLSFGWKPDEVTLSNVLGAYIETGNLNEAARIFREIKKKDKVCYTMMIVGCIQLGKEEEALKVYCEMLLEGVKPDCVTISSVISSCAKLASLHNGQALHGSSVLMGVDHNLLVSSALVNMYCKCGNTVDAYAVFSMMPMKNVVSWNSIIGGYAQNGRDLEALDLFEEMLRNNIKPDVVTFVSVLSACSHAGFIEQGQRYFDSISEKYGLTPSLDHYACMISLLGRSGDVDKAVNMIKGMPHLPDPLIWSTLLSICSGKSDITHAEVAARKLFKLEPSNAAPYIMLSNLYAKLGRWNDVASVRSLMKARNVKKFAAYSWVEMGDKIFKFVSDDRTHPETEGIYEELGRLKKKLQDAGFKPDTKAVLHDVVEEEKFESVCYHSEKLALAFWLMKKPEGTAPIRIMKNIRVCDDCHAFMKLASKVIGLSITLRDSTRFHHLEGGICSCRDRW